MLELGLIACGLLGLLGASVFGLYSYLTREAKTPYAAIRRADKFEYDDDDEPPMLLAPEDEADRDMDAVLHRARAEVERGNRLSSLAHEEAEALQARAELPPGQYSF